MEHTLTISRQDWSLHRKGMIDSARHQEKVKEAIRSQLPEVISQEAIITSDGKQTVKVPIRGLDLPRFKYNYSKGSERVGQGDGQGRGQKAGDQPGEDYYEAEIDIDTLAEMLFEDFHLPRLQNKPNQQMTTTDERWDDRAKAGPMSNLDKKKTILEAMKRCMMQGKTFKVCNEDRRYRVWNEVERPTTSAVVIAMRDVSASMGEWEKYISRTFYFWMVRFLRTRYEKVEVKFITHHTEAQVVDEQTFFSLGESGGTRASSAYQLALELISKQYDPGSWNIYPFHFSDGDNWGDDSRKANKLVKELIDRCNLFGYGEIRQNSGWMASSTLMKDFMEEFGREEKFVAVEISAKDEVYPALKKFFGPQM